MADHFGLSRTAIYYRIEQPSFPVPFATLRGGRVWNRDEVLGWAASWTNPDHLKRGPKAKREIQD